MMWTTMQNSEAVRKPALPFLSDWADKYITRRKTNQFTISDLNGMSTYSFAWKGSKLLQVSNSELSQQENRGGCFLKHLKGICYCRWLDYWTRVKEPDPLWSYRNNKQGISPRRIYFWQDIPQTLLFFW